MEIETSNQEIDLKRQVAIDLKKKLSEFRDPKIGMRLLAEKVDVSERTLHRLLNEQNRPTYQTLYKLYRVLFSTTNDSLLLELVPPVVKDEIEKYNPNTQDKSIIYSADIESEILYDRCFAEIYFMASCYPISREFIQYRYGLSGLETVEKMIELRALKQTRDGNYTLGDNQANFSGKTLKRAGLAIAEKFAKPENAETGGENVIAFYAEGLSDEAYEEWLKIDEEAFHKKVELANKPGAKGTKRAFTFAITDTLNTK
ncbi:DNA-binding helix-turn-helix protein [Bacteriovorax sp. BSW11_IV]|uniref:transcriptional regulator n=1 Tax=Bacteriovorax sp. BSW11_IV TaxID=1353529 RepID=UPI00038A415A|nr:transcriptional regulator [Bacteriovorax sp. BSW11_IV]EQC48323.1 DNA-binding helix-turn-helix protein [Bacteriovorax sp. BSW11_IV]